MSPQDDKFRKASFQVAGPKILDLALERKREYGKESYRFRKAPDRRRQGDSGAPCGPGAWPGSDQYHGVLQAVQRQNQPERDGGTDYPGCRLGLQRPLSSPFITKTPPASILLKPRRRRIAKGSGVPNKDKVGKVTAKQVEDIAKQKMPDLNAASVETAIKSIRGTARSMGIEVVGD